jgi:hypothetical protein
VTVQEVLADTKLTRVNLLAQAQIDADKKVLQGAAGGGLTFVKAPVLFVGNASGGPAGFATGRSVKALTPDLANVQQVNGKLYFARQFGPKSAKGQDIFETYVTSHLAGALFVGDWDLDHRLDAEVHCGSIAKPTIPKANMWTRLA